MPMRFATPLAAVFLAVSTSAMGASPQPSTSSLEALLAKSRTASGAPYRYHIVSRSREVRDGQTLEVTTETQGLKYRATSCLRELCTGFYFDGDRSYQVNYNDTMLPVSSSVDGLQLTLRAIASYAFTDPDFRRDGGTLVERDPLVRNGTAYRRVSIAPRLGALLDAVIDPATGLVRGVISEEPRYVFEFTDQRKIGDRATLPYAISVNGNALTQYQERIIVDAPLEAPKGIVPDFSAGGTTVPMQPRDTDRPVVPCTVGEQPASCLLDTGDSGLAISLELSEKLNLEPVAGSYDVHGVGQYVTGIVVAPSLHVGSATYPSAKYVVLHDLARYGCDVILGADAFAHASVTLDFARREVRLAASAAPLEATPITFDGFVPVVPVGLDDQDVPLQIDTGDDGAVDLSGDYYGRHPELFTANASTSVSGIGGSAGAVSGTISRVRFAGFELERQPIVATKGLSFDGHIGSGLLQHFIVTFDYQDGLAGFVPRPDDVSVKPAGARAI
jgi:hypothetical protein